MRLTVIATITFMLILFGSVNAPKSYADDNGDWVKYATWKGQVDNLLILSFYQESVRSIYPVSAGFRNSSYTYHMDPPKTQMVAKVEVNMGRGQVWLRKQYFHRQNQSIQVLIFDSEPDFGDYEITVYLSAKTPNAALRLKLQQDMDTAAFVSDTYHMNKALAQNNLVDALRWAKSAYEINRLNWDILNTLGELYYLKKMNGQAIDVFIVLRDHGYLTEENWERFREISPYEASKSIADADVDDDENEEFSNETELSDVNQSQQLWSREIFPLGY